MSQHDLTIDNQGFPAFRADLNNALQALGSTQSGTSAPSPTFANQLWYDTTNNQLKIRNEDNDAWIVLATLDQTGDVTSGVGAKTLPAGDIVGTSDSQTLTNKTINASQLVDNSVTPAKLSSTAQYTGFKNRIINGSMEIWQRGTSFTGVGAIVYYADRWSGIQFAGSTSTITQATNIGLNGFRYALRAQRPVSSSNTNSINVGQSVESANCLDLAGQSVTLSFYARAGANFSAASNILLSQITTGTGIDQNIYGTYTGGSTSNQNNTISTAWARYSHTITVPSNATEIGVSFNYTPTGTAGASDFYEITGVQLELGSTATSWDVRSYAQELALCQRYYEKSYHIEVAPATNTFTGGKWFITGSATGNLGGNVNFAVAKRANPTITTYPIDGSPAGSWNTDFLGELTTNVIGIGTSGFSIYLSAGGSVAGAVFGHYVASIEL